MPLSRIEDLWNQFFPSSFFMPDWEAGKVCEVLSFLPEGVAEAALNKTVFTLVDGAEYIPFRHFLYRGRRGLILLPKDLFKRSKVNIAFTIAHEIAHCLKNHCPRSAEETAPDARIADEIVADKQAVEWLSHKFKKSALMKQCVALKSEGGA